MKKNELAEIKKMDIKTIVEKIKKMNGELADLAVDKAMAKLTNLKALKNKRKEMAQILTILRQKQLLQDLERKES